MLSLDDQDLLEHPDVRLALATELFKCGHLSLGRAARVANTPLVDFLKHLSSRRIPVIREKRARSGRTSKPWTSGALRHKRRRPANVSGAGSRFTIA